MDCIRRDETNVEHHCVIANKRSELFNCVKYEHAEKTKPNTILMQCTKRNKC